jgi:endonuclease/exonuclease/phosphatase family metal-dependent hydrolase
MILFKMIEDNKENKENKENKDMCDNLAFIDVPSQIVLPKKNHQDVRIMTYNLHGFKNQFKKKRLDEIIKVIGAIGPDIVVFQEIHVYKPNEGCTQEQLKEYLAPFGLLNYSFSLSGINAIFSKYPFMSKEINLGRDQKLHLPRNALIATFPNVDILNDLVIVGTHLDPFDESGVLRIKQMSLIIKCVNDLSQSIKRFIIAGDFNSLRRDDYTESEWESIKQTDSERNVVTTTDCIPLLEELHYIDAMAYCGKPIKVSVWSNRRVDYIYGNNVKFIQASELKTTHSDHYPIYADF